MNRVGFPAHISLRAAAIILAAAAVMTSSAAARQVPTGPAEASFTPESLMPAERQALLAQAATRRFDRASAADALQFLARQGREQEAVPLAMAEMLARPEKIGEILDGLMKVGEWLQDRPGGVREALTAALPELRTRIATLPREQAAGAAYSLLLLQLTLDQQARERAPRGTASAPLDKLALLSVFIREHEGTAAADLASLEFFVEEDTHVTSATRLSPTTVRLGDYPSALDKYARAHPGTVSGAKALYQLAETKGWGGPNGADRLRETLRIVAELESGKYPPCEWVNRAPMLVTMFGYDSLAVRRGSAEDFDFVVTAMKEFALKQLDAKGTKALPIVEPILVGRLPRLLHDQRVADGANRTFDELARIAKNPDLVRYLRAQYDNRGLRFGDEPDDRATSAARSNQTLRELSLRADPPLKELALVRLASQLYAQRDFLAAAAVHQRIVDEFPGRDATWVSAIALGQAQAELRNFETARLNLRTAAETYADRPIARIVGLAFAAQASAALGELKSELADLQRALEAWDPAFGPSFVLNGNFMIDPVGVPVAMGSGTPNSSFPGIRRDTLLARVGAIPALLTRDNGSEFEMARRQFEREDFDSALPTLDRLAKDFASPFQAEAATLARRARLNRALTWVGVGTPHPNESTAIRDLEELAAGPEDFTAAAALIARAAVAWTGSKPDDARPLMRQGLEAWRKTQQEFPAPTKGSLEEDVLQIRDALFRRGGPSSLVELDGSFGRFPPGSHPYLLAPAVTTVRLSSGRSEEVAIARAPEGLPNVLFLTPDQEAFLTKILVRFGADATPFYRAYGQPGPPRQILTLIYEFFPVWPGTRTAWQFYAPMIEGIRYEDEQRTRAEVSLTDFSSGSGHIVEKRDGVWTFVKSTFFWIN